MSLRVIDVPSLIIVGGFFGDEGKGKIAAYLALSDKPEIIVRTGSVNAGHTVVFNGKTFKLRVIPSGFISRGSRLLIAPGALVRLDILFKEITETGTRGRVLLDYNTGIIEERHVEAELADRYFSQVIGSTLQGVGAAMIDRVARRLKLARDFEELRGITIDVPGAVNEALSMGGLVHVEGTQGSFLSLYHGTYPYVTSRDTTASAIASEVGLGPKHVDDVVVVFKAYVTRVGNGPLPGELDYSEALKLGWVEEATVTRRIRRAAPFSIELARRAVMLNSATQIALTKLDVLYKESRGCREWSCLPVEARKWVEYVEDSLKTPVSLIGTCEEVDCVIDRRRELGLLR